jgi:hypothetical protein
MLATARSPVPQVTHGQGASTIKRALQELQNQALEPIDINKLRIEQTSIFLDFYYEFDPKVPNITN